MSDPLKRKPEWKNLLDRRCPIDNMSLVKKGSGYECLLASEPKKLFRCEFFITDAKYELMREKIRKDSYGRAVRNSFYGKFSHSK